MRHPPRWIFPLIVACLFLATSAPFLAQTAGGNRGNPGRPPTGGPDVGLPGSKQPTTRPGSHESSAKDEVDRVSGKFPAPKEKNDSDQARRNAASRAGTVYVDVVAIEGQRQAVALTRDDLQVSIDGARRMVVSLHYVFRGPQAAQAGRSIPVGRGVLAHADEARTIVILVDEASFAPAAEQSVRAHLQHLAQVVGPVDRVALLALPRPGALKFVGTRDDLLNAVARVVSRPAPTGEASASSLDALPGVLTDLAKIEGPKSVIIFSAAPAQAFQPTSAASQVYASRMAAIADAAAASRAVLHVVTPAEAGVGSTELTRLARATGGTTTRLTGEPDDLAPLAAALLGGYIVEVESSAADRDGATHALAVTTAAKGVRLLVPTRWKSRFDPLPAPVVVAKPAGTR